MPQGTEPGHNHGRMLNDEKERSLSDIGDRLQKIGKLIAERNLRLGAHQIAPPEECLFIIRYERMPEGELSLKLELKWYEGERPIEGDLAGDIDIGTIKP